MRQLNFMWTFLVLWVAVYLIWQHRFERSPDSFMINAEDLRQHSTPTPGAEWLGSGSETRIRLRVDSAHPRVVDLIDLPKMNPGDFLHIRSRIATNDLIPGKEVWDDGRCIIEWRQDGVDATSASDSFASGRLNHRGERTDLVLRPQKGSLSPVLRLENLGKSGDLELCGFEATAVRNTSWWKIGRWLVAGAWLWWVWAWIGEFENGGRFRRMLAALMWVVLGAQCVVPGPWYQIRPFGASFAIEREARFSGQAPPRVAPTPLAVPSSLTPPPQKAVESVGKLPPKGSLVLRIKTFVGQAKAILHVIMILVPTLITASLVGSRPAGTLGMILSLSIEIAETAFGFGFDPMDILDLLCDFTGVVLALWIWRFLKKAKPRLVSFDREDPAGEQK